jgi:RimJ/RimL family protein N-acetyltransferase
VLVSFGSTDPFGGTELALEALLLAGIGAAVDVVVGSGMPDIMRVRRLAEMLSPEALIHVDVRDMATLTHNADIAIGAGGMSALERCCLGVPSLLVTVAENQVGLAEALGRAGAVSMLGKLASLTVGELTRSLRDLAHDAPRRRLMGEAAREITDGLGAARARVSCYPPLRAKDNGLVELRPARLADAEVMLAWQSVPGIRAFSHNSEAPEPTHHRQWLRQKLGDANCVFNVVLHGGRPAGVLRFDRDPQGTYTVSVLIAKGSQNMGIGGAALNLANRLLPRAEMRAVISPDNRASVRMFERAGYRPVGSGIWTLASAPGLRAYAHVT